MPKVMRALLFVVLCLAVSIFATDLQAPWHLSDVLRLASDKVDQENNSVQNARLELQMLEALNRTRVEFRPQLNILSFSNPLFLAAGLGGSISINRRTAPSPVTLELARFAVVDAELGRAQARITAQVEATHQFFALAEAQDSALRNCQLWEQRTRDRNKMQQLVAFNRATRLDLIRFEQDVTSLESNCVEAKAQARAAATSLVRYIGANTPADQVQIVTEDLDQAALSSDMNSSQKMVELALDSQRDLKLVFQHMSNLASPDAHRRIHFESLSGGYSYLKNVEPGAPSDWKKYLLGGNVGHIDAGFYISLRNTGDVLATTSFLQSRFESLQKRLGAVKLMVLQDIEDNQQRAVLATDRLRIAQKKQQLADELHILTVQRSEVGLQAIADETWTNRDAIRSEGEMAHLDLEKKQNIFTLMAICDPERINQLTVAFRDIKANSTPSVGAAFVSEAVPRKAFPISFALQPSPQTNSTTQANEPQQKSNAISAEVRPPLYVPPTPVKKVMPDLKLLRESLLFGINKVDVELKIDVEGRVIAVRPINQDKANALLTKQVVAAAKQWVFEPAKMRGRNIPCDHKIEFQFRPQV